MKEKLLQFREQLYQSLYLHNRADAIFDLIDALSSAQGIQSPAERTLLPAFRRRHYSALYQGVADFALQRDETLSLLLPLGPAPHRRPFRLYSVDLKVWFNMRIRGTRRHPMHGSPFTLIQVTITTPDGRPLYRCLLWLAFFGPKRRVWAPKLIYEAYRQRFDQEHTHRLLPSTSWAQVPPPDTDHEQHRWRIVALAYCQLWPARPLAQAQWRPWEKHRAKKHGPSPVRALSSTHVQRGFQRILSHMGTPARRLKPRGKSRGWPPGRRCKRRPRRKIVCKGRQKAP